MLENHSLFVKAYAHKHGMRLSIEPYDMNPMQDLELGASADIYRCVSFGVPEDIILLSAL